MVLSINAFVNIACGIVFVSELIMHDCFEIPNGYVPTENI